MGYLLCQVIECYSLLPPNFLIQGPVVVLQKNEQNISNKTRNIEVQLPGQGWGPQH